MKKISLLLVISCIVLITGCSNVKTETNSSSKGSSQLQNSESNSKLNYENFTDLPDSLLVELSTVKYEINTPNGYSRAQTGWYSSTKTYYVIYDQYVSNTSDTDYSISLQDFKTSKDVIEGMKEQFINTGADKLPLCDQVSYSIIKQYEVVINGWNMCKSQGVFKLSEDVPTSNKNYKFVAYSVLKDNCPVYFVVVDKTTEQSQETLINDLADKIAKTFRDVK